MSVEEDREEVKNCFITKERKLVMEMTPQEYDEFSKKGLPHDLAISIKEKRSNNADDDTACGWKRPEVLPEEFEALRESEAEERANNA